MSHAACYVHGMSTADFYCYGPDGRLALIVEARARTATTNTAWAAQVRQERLAESPADQQAAFAIVTLEALYVWDAGAPADRVADYEASLGSEDFRSAFGAYLERAGITASSRVDDQVLELVVAWWLDDIAAGAYAASPFMLDTGVPQLVGGGRVEQRTAA